jgi:hypothetical protein
MVEIYLHLVAGRLAHVEGLKKSLEILILQNLGVVKYCVGQG